MIFAFLPVFISGRRACGGEMELCAPDARDQEGEMNTINQSGARAIADPATGDLLAAVELCAAPERVFRALASPEITEWWVRPGVFDTREWAGEVRVGGRWRAAGMTRGQPYAQEGEFLRVQSPEVLVHTWEGAARPGESSTVTYRLEPVAAGTRVTLRHAGFASRDVCEAFAIGWQTSFDRLAEILAREDSRA
jgi:uncharacterized protein YndB with AHSA1/START domain